MLEPMYEDCTLEPTYEGCYCVPTNCFDITAWNKAGDFGYFEDGFTHLHSVEPRDEWIS